MNLCIRYVYSNLNIIFDNSGHIIEYIISRILVYITDQYRIYYK